MTTSRWRAGARNRINAVLAALPPEATRKDAERALRQASPYAARHAGDGLSWGSKCWAKERRIALDFRFPPPRKPPAPVQSPGFVLGPKFPGVSQFADSWPWLSVRCDWCDNARPGGCLQCCHLHDWLAAVVANPHFRSLRAAAAADPELLGVLKDYLADVHGIEMQDG